MKNISLILMLIALLVVGMLVVKNLTSEKADSKTGIEIMQNAKKMEKEAGKKAKELINRLDESLNHD